MLLTGGRGDLSGQLLLVASFDSNKIRIQRIDVSFGPTIYIYILYYIQLSMTELSENSVTPS